MIIFLHGQDTYRLQQKLSQLVERYKKTHENGLGLERVSAKENSFQEFWDIFQQQSMFIKKKLFILEGLFQNKEFEQGFLKKIKLIADSKDIVVAVEKEKFRKTDRLFCGLKKHGQAQEFKPLQPSQIKTKVVKEFQKQGISIEKQALDLLYNFVGDDLWQLFNEVQKLVSYKKSEVKPLVKTSDIKAFVKPKLETDVFKTIEALAKRDKKTALHLLGRHLEKGESPFYLLTMIAFQFRNLLMVKSSLAQPCFLNYSTAKAMANDLDMHPFVFQKAVPLAGRFSLAELKKIFEKIFYCDFNVKTGKISAEQGIKSLIAEI